MPLLKILRVMMPTFLELVARIVATAFSLAKKEEVCQEGTQVCRGEETRRPSLLSNRKTGLHFVGDI